MTDPLLHPLGALLAGAASALAAVALARLAPRLGWLDRPRGAARKRQPWPVPPVGGLALALGLAVAFLAGGGRGGAALLGESRWLGLCGGGALALAVGFVDDLWRGGLRPGAKLVGQVAAGCAFALPSALAIDAAGPALAAGLGLVLAAVVAQNAVNTFDNADGAASALGLAALAAPAPALAGALGGLLPLHLARRRSPFGAGRTWPQIYLGDAGSHLLGVVLIAVPGAWPALCLPVLDLARVALARLRAGQAPWIGDRRHLAHLLEERGTGRAGVVALLVGLVLPSAGLGAAGLRSGEPLVVAAGLLATTALYAVTCAALRLERARRAALPLRTSG